MSRDVPCPKESKSNFKRTLALCARGSAGSYVSGKPLLPFCRETVERRVSGFTTVQRRCSQICQHDLTSGRAQSSHGTLTYACAADFLASQNKGVVKMSDRRQEAQTLSACYTCLAAR